MLFRVRHGTDMASRHLEWPSNPEFKQSAEDAAVLPEQPAGVLRRGNRFMSHGRPSAGRMLSDSLPTSRRFSGLSRIVPSTPCTIFRASRTLSGNAGGSHGTTQSSPAEELSARQHPVQQRPQLGRLPDSRHHDLWRPPGLLGFRQHAGRDRRLHPAEGANLPRPRDLAPRPGDRRCLRAGCGEPTPPIIPTISTSWPGSSGSRTNSLA